MKKVGFTLAEVLITLAIIGVVAVLTLPALMSNTAEQQARTALKKMTNSLTQAASMNSAIAGFDFSGVSVTSSTADEDALTATGSLMAMFLDRLNVDRSLRFAPSGGTPAQGTTPAAGPCGTDMAVYLKDGTAVYFTSTDTTNNAQTAGDQFRILADGVMDGIPVIFDTNGVKGPNQVSNCSGDVTGSTAFTADDTGDCTNKSSRIIKDQYMMKLRGSQVGALGACSTWMLDDTQFTPNSYTQSPGTATVETAP